MPFLLSRVIPRALLPWRQQKKRVFEKYLNKADRLTCWLSGKVQHVPILIDNPKWGSLPASTQCRSPTLPTHSSACLFSFLAVTFVWENFQQPVVDSWTGFCSVAHAPFRGWLVPAATPPCRAYCCTHRYFFVHRTFVCMSVPRLLVLPVYLRVCVCLCVSMMLGRQSGRRGPLVATASWPSATKSTSPSPRESLNNHSRIMITD